ncbi:opacity protein-like surface antigen [Legionella quinlivanii]|uniref:Opacity protein-like surface antigen n=1 Tax=Legionella quinlivanii TaxID=45073 RepID=A0A0W0XNG6_9GAMM|nr:outer membrane beta-barrel protein [Legionella quinlivanii]KTD46104.1 opacity protein-like surface antigen [Legionella quinlivanii]SEG28583.1 Opacity protein [Legionella quinlivanii DSM 21216]STY10601.1 opacity protein-like surface antigen [Legionella quinlivanii]
MRTVFFSAALMASGAACAAVPIDGWYASVFGGFTSVQDNISVSSQGWHRSKAGYDNNYNVGGRLGYKCTPLRYEGELTYLTADLDHFYIDDILQTGITGDTNAILAMANVYYDFPDMVPGIQPFLGVGIGYAYVNVDLNSTGPLGVTRYSGSNSVFAYQGTGGFTYNFSEIYSVDIAYRYIGTQRPDELGKVYQAHLGTVGVTYRFDGSRYK